MLACTHRRPPTFWAVLFTLLLASSLHAGATRDELLRYVPADIGFCLVVQDVRGHSNDLLASPFVREWSKSSFGSALLASGELKQLVKVSQYMEKYLGISPIQLRDEIFGDAFVFAYRPGPAGKPDQEQGLFLLRARNEKALAALVKKLNALQKLTGELKDLVEREHKGVKYVRRVEGKNTSYYLLRGSVLLFTGQEAFLKEAIERDKSLDAKAKPPLARRLEDLNLDGALVALTIEPRSFDAAVAGKAATDPAAKTVAGYWKALQGVGLGVHLHRDLQLSLTIKARTDQLPASARRFLASASKTSELWSSFPDNALFSMAGRLDASALYEVLGEFVTRASRESMEAGLERSLGAVLGKDVIKELLPALGPDWGLCLMAPSARGKHWAPRTLFALKVAPGDTTDPIDQALLKGAHTWAQLAVLGHNSKSPGQPIVLRSLLGDKVRVRYLSGEGAFPPGIKPAFALKSGYLVLASSPDEVKRFKVAPTAAKAGATPLLRVSVKDFRLPRGPTRRAGRRSGGQGEDHQRQGAREDRWLARQPGNDRSNRAAAKDAIGAGHPDAHRADGAAVEEVTSPRRWRQRILNDGAGAAIPTSDFFPHSGADSTEEHRRHPMRRVL